MVKQNMEKGNYLNVLCQKEAHILEQIFTNLEPEDVLNCCHVSAHLRKFITENPRLSEWIQIYLKTVYF